MNNILAFQYQSKQLIFSVNFYDWLYANNSGFLLYKNNNLTIYSLQSHTLTQH